jgi:RNA polymerase sigma-70 factor (ECF subfamily)
VVEPAVASVIDAAYRTSWGRVIAAAFRLTGDLGLAEEAAADSFAAALTSWPDSGVPDSVEAWLVTAARRRAIDQIRRHAVLRSKQPLLLEDEGTPADTDAELDELRFLALCMGEGLSQQTQILLLLKFGCGITTQALAVAHHVPIPTMAARLTRARQRLQRTIRTSALAAEIEPVLPLLHRAIYLIFTHGRMPPAGSAERDHDRLLYADFLSTTVHRHWPSSESAALRILILVNEDPPRLDEALALTSQVHHVTALSTQAAIMLEHACAGEDDRDWLRIAELYDVLLSIEPNPTFAVGRAVAVGHAFGPGVGLADLEDLGAHADLSGDRYFHAARAHCLARLGRHDEAALAYVQAAARSTNTQQRDFFARMAGQ